MNIEPKELYIRYLVLLNSLIEKVQSSSINESDFLNARLFEDMFPLKVQVKIATNFALRACCPLSGQKYQELDGGIDSIDELKACVLKTIDSIEQLPFSTIDPLKSVVKDTAGFNEISMPASEYVSSFALPNFFFHLSMIYAIVKSCGVSVTKGDFDGIHHYPTGFSWEDSRTRKPKR